MTAQLGVCVSRSPGGKVRVQTHKLLLCDFAVVEAAGASRRRSVAAVHVLDTLRAHAGHKLDTH